MTYYNEKGFPVEKSSLVPGKEYYTEKGFPVVYDSKPKTLEQKAERLSEKKPKSGFDWDPSKETREEFAKRSQEQMERELSGVSQRGLYEKALLPRTFEQRQKGEKPTLGGTLVDWLSFAPREGLALLEGGLAAGEEIYTGRDLPIGEIMFESLGRTGGTDDMGFWRSTGEDIFRDFTTYIPGIGQAKRIKDLGTLAKLGAMGVYEAGLEATSQFLDPTREMDYGSIIVGGLTPWAGEGMKKIGSDRFAKDRYGEGAKTLLEEDLIPFFGKPKQGLEKRVKELGETRVGELKESDELKRSVWQAAPDALIKHGADPVDAAEAVRMAQRQDLDDIGIKVEKKVEDLVNEGVIRPEMGQKIKFLMDDELQEFTDMFSDATLPLYNRSNLWRTEAGTENARSWASKLLLDETKPLLNSLKTQTSKRLKNLEDIKLKDSDLSQKSIPGLAIEAATSPPVINALYGGGKILQRPQRPYFGVGPGTTKALFGDKLNDIAGDIMSGDKEKKDDKPK